VNKLKIHIKEFLPEIQDGYIIIYVHTEIFENKQQVFCVCMLKFCHFLFEKSANLESQLPLTKVMADDIMLFSYF
jgi:hypothetical protein